MPSEMRRSKCQAGSGKRLSGCLDNACTQCRSVHAAHFQYRNRHHVAEQAHQDHPGCCCEDACRRGAHGSGICRRPSPAALHAATTGHASSRVCASRGCRHSRWAPRWTAAAQWGICSSCAIRDVALPLALMSVLPCAIGKQSPAPAGGQKPSPAASGADGAPSAAGPPHSAGSGQSSGELEVAHAGTWITLSCPVLVLACLIS